MTKCFVCGKGLKKNDSMRGIVVWHLEAFCLKCLIQWREAEKQRSISVLYEGGDPIPLFIIPGVQTPDPTEQKDNRFVLTIKGNIFFGPLIFTNRGIYLCSFTNLGKKQFGTGGIFLKTVRLD
jgi:hypothetical protein